MVYWRKNEPLGVLRDGTTRVLLAILNWPGPFRPTITDICKATSMKSKNTVWKHLETLKAHGLIAAESNKRGTIRPLVQAIPVGTEQIPDEEE